jgi:hypothetical protein
MISFPERRAMRRGTVGAEPPRAHLQALILATYRDMPGLSLHLPQAARLLGLRHETCRIVFDDLTQEGHLRRTNDGQYVLRFR